MKLLRCDYCGRDWMRDTEWIYKSIDFDLCNSCRNVLKKIILKEGKNKIQRQL